MMQEAADAHLYRKDSIDSQDGLKSSTKSKKGLNSLLKSFGSSYFYDEVIRSYKRCFYQTCTRKLKKIIV